MSDALRTRVYRVVSGVLAVPVERLTDDVGPDNTASWDSMSHLNLVLAVESEFGVSLTDDDVTDMLSVGLICRILRDRGVSA